MNTPSSTAIYEKLERIEQELQKLKLEAFRVLPPKRRSARYSERSILKALRETRQDIWRKRYAKKVARLS